MTGITTIALARSDQSPRHPREAQQVRYRLAYSTPVPPLVDDAAGMVAGHSLIPEALHDAFATFGALLSQDLPLEFLLRMTSAVDLAEAIRRDFSSTAISAADRAMLEYAGQITLDATGVTDEQHARVGAAGFDDLGILQITLIAAWFTYIKRVAEALGVGTT